MCSSFDIAPTGGWGSQKPPLGVELDRGHPLSRGLVSCLALNEGNGLLATDAVRGVRFDAYGTTSWTPSPSGQAFVGASGALTSMWTPPAYPNGLTVSLLWKRVSNTEHTYFGYKRYSGTSGFTFLARKTGYDYWTARVGDGSNQDGVDFGGIPITDGVWQRVTFALDCSGANVVVNGYENGRFVQSGTATGATTVGAGDYPLRLGIDALYNGYLMDGVLADWFMWDRKLSASEVARHHAEPHGMFTAETPLAGVSRSRQLIDGSPASDAPLLGAVA